MGSVIQITGTMVEGHPAIFRRTSVQPQPITSVTYRYLLPQNIVSAALQLCLK